MVLGFKNSPSRVFAGSKGLQGSCHPPGVEGVKGVWLTRCPLGGVVSPRLYSSKVAASVVGNGLMGRSLVTGSGMRGKRDERR